MKQFLVCLKIEMHINWFVEEENMPIEEVIRRGYQKVLYLSVIYQSSFPWIYSSILTHG